MRIGFDDSPLRTGHAGRGIGYYTRYLLDELEKIPDIQIVKFSGDPNKCEDVDLVHIPYFDVYKRSLPILKRFKTIVTIHDLIPIAYNEHFAPGIRGSISWQMQRQSAQGCAHIITDSDASRRAIVRFVGINEKKVTSILLAPGPQFSRAISAENMQKAAMYNLPASYFLYVGDINWNKNVLGLIDAYAQLDEEVRNRVHLVCIGVAFTHTELAEMVQIKARIKQYQLEEFVHMPGRVDDLALPAIYASALCLVQPSFAEGFGLPVLESMAAGCPVVCTTQTSLAEIAGPAITVNAQPDDIARGMGQILAQSELERQKMIQSGIAWASAFTWKKVAQETAEVYKKALDLI